jgi:hypothetical protein
MGSTKLRQNEMLHGLQLQTKMTVPKQLAHVTAYEVIVHTHNNIYHNYEMVLQ